MMRTEPICVLYHRRTASSSHSRASTSSWSDSSRSSARRWRASTSLSRSCASSRSTTRRRYCNAQSEQVTSALKWSILETCNYSLVVLCEQKDEITLRIQREAGAGSTKLRIELKEAQDRASQLQLQVYYCQFVFQYSILFVLYITRNSINKSTHRWRLWQVEALKIEIEHREERIVALSEQLEASRKAINDRETELAKMRIEMRDSGSKLVIVEVRTWVMK